MTDLTIVQNSSIANTMVRCSELLIGIESIHERADAQEVIDIAFKEIQENFWLVPKVTVSETDEIVMSEKPISAIPEILSDIWLKFTDEVA